MAELVVPPLHGTLNLTPDGAFTYSPNATFTGLNSFVYAAVSGTISDQATVFLAACTGGPEVFVCWEEEAFLAMANDLGYFASHERLDGPVWDVARAPSTTSSITSQGVRWASNFIGEIMPGTRPLVGVSAVIYGGYSNLATNSGGTWAVSQTPFSER